MNLTTSMLRRFHAKYYRETFVWLLVQIIHAGPPPYTEHICTLDASPKRPFRQIARWYIPLGIIYPSHQGSKATNLLLEKQNP